jgi:putative transposase
MPDDTPDLTAPEVLQHAYSTLQEHLPLHAAGYTCTTDDLLKVLLGVAVNRSTIEAVCADLAGTPDPQTIRGYFNTQLRVEDLPDLERRLNAALAAEVPSRVRRHAREVAIDYHDRPYYGKVPQAEGLWVRGHAKAGTTRFYRIATAYLRLNNLRVTLSLHFVVPGEDTVRVLDTLLRRVNALGVEVTCLLLDKGFDGIAVMDYLTRHQYPALIACTIQGTTGGTRALCQGRRSYCMTHLFTGAQGQKFLAAVAVCRVFTTARRTKRLKRRAEWVLFILIRLALSPRFARQLYRGRFGIETSYRCAGRVRGWTTAINPAYRFVLIAVAFVLLNVWLHLRWIFTQVPRRGGRWLDTTRLPLTRFAAFIRRSLEHLYGCTHIVVAPAVPRC